MKKALILVAAVAMGATFTSCKKDYACECTYTFMDETVTEEGETFKDTKKNAEDKCADTEQEGKDAGFDDTSCEAKKK